MEKDEANNNGNCLEHSKITETLFYYNKGSQPKCVMQRATISWIIF